MISLIAAAGLDGVIGKGNKLPWEKIEADMRHFYRTTKGHTVVMGKKTFESIGSKPLPKRDNIVLTHDKTFKPEGVIVAHNTWDVMAHQHDNKHLFVIGGATLYHQFMDYANFIFLTRIFSHFDGDTHFPVLSKDEWEIKRQVNVQADIDTPYDLSFIVFGRNYHH